MRVIAGKARGMRLECPSGRDVRPTPDRVREALFNILRDRVAGSSVLDLFAGCGGIGIEALSRGAAWCVFVERSPRVRAVLERNLAHTRLAECSDLLQRDVFGCLPALQKLDRAFDVLYLGPPFPVWQEAAPRDRLFQCLDEFSRAGLLRPRAVLVAQHEAAAPMPERAAGLPQRRTREYGRYLLTFYEA